MPRSGKNFIVGLFGLLFLACMSACKITSHEVKENTVTTIPATNSAVKITGRTRTTSTGAAQFGYPGITFELAISGGDLTLDAYSTSNNSYLALFIDDLPEQVIPLSTRPQTIALVADDGKSHRIKLSHRSETWHGIVTLDSFTLNNGNFLTPPPIRTRKMLVIGDSVTCGEAIERVASCEKESRWWNPELSYGLRIAKALNADGHLICYGGRGVTRSWNGKTDELQAPDFYELTIAQEGMPEWDHTNFTPELILISLGTNDFSLGIGPLPEQAHFVSTYKTFVERLLSLHPKAQIVLTEGAIVNDYDDPSRPQKTVLRQYLNDTLQALNHPRVHVVASMYYPGDACDAHPNKTQHAAMADDLTPVLRNIMQW